MRGLAIDGEPLEFLMRFDEEGSAGGFVGAARFHSDQAIFDEVGAADAVFRGDFVERVEQIDGAKFRTVDGTGVPDSNPISTSSALSGAFSGETTHCHIASFGALAGSSSSPPSWLRCQMLRSRL